MSPAEMSSYIRLRCIEAAGGCLHWNTRAASEVRRRHPIFRVPGERSPVLARRKLFEAEKGEIRRGYGLLPKCGDDCCIEPEHQKQISQRQKSQAGAERGKESPTRAAKVAATRVRKGMSKLTEQQVLLIRSSDEQGRVWARRLGVHEKTISDARLGKTWRNAGGNPFAALLSGGAAG